MLDKIIKASGRTAMKRKGPSSPCKWLVENDLFPKVEPIRVLDYGCGHGADVDYLNTFDNIVCDGYDPNHRPVKITDKYDFILCTYVFNCLPHDTMIDDATKDMLKHLKNDGTIYITVRADTKSLTGWKCFGTFQRLINLDLPLVHENSGWKMYELGR